MTKINLNRKLTIKQIALELYNSWYWSF